jgi:hypothetical protein
MQMRSGDAEANLRTMYSFFVNKLLDAFPGNGEIVQKYLFSTGCSKEECRIILETKIDRNKTTKHFFKGLPPSPPEPFPPSKK